MTETGQTNKDIVRNYLLTRGEVEVATTVDQIVGGTKLNASQIYNILHSMEKNNEISVVREQLPSGYRKISDIRLIKMERKEVIEDRVKEAAGKKISQMELKKASSNLKATMEYAEQKLAIEEAKQVLLKHNMSSTYIFFEENPLGEDALWLLAKCESLIENNYQLKSELKAANNLISNLGGKPKENNAEESQPLPVSASSH